MVVRVAVEPRVLAWARERSGRSEAELHKRFPKLSQWEQRERQPTLKQLERFSRATHTPIGYLFLGEPPNLEIPIPDMRTIADTGVRHPSPNLLDTIYLCQRRQDWYREYAQVHRQARVELVGIANIDDPVERAADALRLALGLDPAARRSMRRWEDALVHLISAAEASGVMVMVSGVVASNTQRKLDTDEFRGFALADDLAPLIFINGVSSKSAQMFTIAHELAHVALGSTALSDAQPGVISAATVERWCNRVAAELLVPAELFLREIRVDAPVPAEAQRLARVFKVSTLVIIRRMLDVHVLGREAFWHEYDLELQRLGDVTRSTTGGNYYLTQPVRLSKRFVRALVVDTLEGRTLYRDAMRLAGTSRVSTLHELGRHVGVEV